MHLDPTPVWYGRHPLSLLLLPLSWLYCGIVRIRRLGYRRGWFRGFRLAVPVIVVGNLTVGGTGKTPLVLRLAELLRERGWRPGILTRGYGGAATQVPQIVTAESDPSEVGDEPVLLARRSGALVVVGRDRVAAGELAIQSGQCDLLLTDDGLQHYRLARDLEVVLVDGEKGFGNGRCLPAGPLREPVSRLGAADFVIYRNGRPDQSSMRLEPGRLVNLARPELTRALEEFAGQRLCAIAGIGHPARFFDLLRAQGIQVDPRPYPDHHRFSERDLATWPDGPVLMTEKDAVKCAAFARENHWFLPVDATLEPEILDAFFSKVAGFNHGQRL